MTIFLRPNPSSGVPVYLQLVEQVKDALETGALRPGDPLPGIRPLAEELVISPNAVARAYRELEAGAGHRAAAGAASRARPSRTNAPPDRAPPPTRRSSRDLALENSRLSGADRR